jgi:hypothetical protein
VSAPYAPAPEWIFGLRKLWPTAEPANLYNFPVNSVGEASAMVASFIDQIERAGEG